MGQKYRQRTRAKPSMAPRFTLCALVAVGSVFRGWVADWIACDKCKAPRLRSIGSAARESVLAIPHRYFADGIVMRLSPTSKVRRPVRDLPDFRNALQRHKKKESPEIARELNVDGLVELIRFSAAVRWCSLRPNCFTHPPMRHLWARRMSVILHRPQVYRAEVAQTKRSKSACS